MKSKSIKLLRIFVDEMCKLQDDCVTCPMCCKRCWAAGYDSSAETVLRTAKAFIDKTIKEDYSEKT